MSAIETDVLNEMIASWDALVPCSHPTKSGRRCRRAGQWWVDFHGCKSGTLCTSHFTKWRDANEAVVNKYGGGECSYCKRRWNASEDYYTAVRL